MTDLVVYYSRTNKTKMVAEIISKQLNARLIEVKDKTKRSGSIGYIRGAFDALRSKRTLVEYDIADLKEYDTVYIGTPVWASKPTPAILEYIKETDFSGVNVVTFATMMSSGDKDTLLKMNEAINEKGGSIVRSFSIKTKNTDIEELTIDALN